MNKLILSLALSLFTLGAASQKIYFVYLQSESQQPFYARVNDKVHSSTGSGYLIIPRLLDSTYNIRVGFPGSNAAELQFNIAVNKKDHGYLLKNFGDKGWGLFDLQTLNVQMDAGAKTAAANPRTDTTDVSPFTAILSKAADDPSLKEKIIKPQPVEKKVEVVAIKEPEKKEESKPVVSEPVVTKTTEPVEKKVEVAIKEPEKKEESKPVVSEPVVTKTTEPVVTKPTEPVITKTTDPVVTKPVDIVPAVVKDEAPVAKPVETDPGLAKKDETEPVKEKPVVTEVKTEETYKPSQVIKGSESTGAEGLDIVYIDQYADGKKDTIRVLIPNPKPIVDPVKTEPKVEKKFLDLPADTVTANQPGKPVEPTVVKEEPAPVVVTEKEKTVAVNTGTEKKMVVNNCRSTAEDADFMKLRRKMVAADNDDDMVSEARKYFKTKCFTVYQVRNLSTLFLSDEGKYKFFDAAYTHTSDVHNFISLQLELKEGYWVNRFKAMLK